jgi:hypothetical protein
MNYYNEDQLFKYFEKSIKKECVFDIESLKKQINKIKDTQMKQIRSELNLKKNVETSKAINDLYSFYEEQINSIGIGYDEVLINLRNTKIEDMFLEIKKDLSSFVESPLYQEYIVKKLNYIKDNYKEIKGKVKVEVSLKDNINDSILSVFKDAKIEKNNNIQYGGFILSSPNISFEFDETFDTKLESEVNKFIEESRIFIKR